MQLYFYDFAVPRAENVEGNFCKQIDEKNELCNVQIVKTK